MAFWEKPKNEEVTLSGLYAALSESQAKLAEYLLKRDAEAQAAVAQRAATPAAMTAEQFQKLQTPVIERLDAIGKMLMDLQGEIPSLSTQLAALPQQISQLVPAAPAPSLPPEPLKISAADLEDADDEPAEAPVPPQVPVPPMPPAAPPVAVAPGLDFSELERAFLGPELAANGAISSERQQLTDGLLRGQPEAKYFVGLWLMFQSAATEKKALLLKDLGEAFYRWTATLPNGAETLEGVFVPQVQLVCEQAGLQNTLELVRVGQRFDNARHTSFSRGVEVVQVKGWVVLRSNGSVYAKALVDVR